MLSWLLENIATVVISVLLVLTVAAVLYITVRSGKKGKSACGCGCGSCPMSGDCHKQ
jgi:hypothetical protein